jgi:hypothetical protein
MLVYKGENYIVLVFFLKVKNRKEEEKKLVFKNCGVPLKSIFSNSTQIKKN